MTPRILPVVTITKDISDADYSDLLGTACQRYAQFSLVWRNRLSFDSSARDIQHELQRFEVARVRRSHWPGTRLIGTHAVIIRYSINAAQTGVLSRPNSLFGWRSPQLPEDLCFYAADGSCAIVSVTHEQRAWFFDEDWLSLLPASSGATLEQPSDDDLQLLQPTV
jgi:hypothetical protein